MSGPLYERYLAIRIKEGTVEGVRVIDSKTKMAEDDARWFKAPLSEVGPDVKLKTVRFDPDQYSSIAELASMNDITEEAFRKLNGLSVDEELKPGSKVQVPRIYQ